MTDSCKSPTTGLAKGLFLTLSVPRVVSFEAVISGEERCVTTLITAAKETIPRVTYISFLPSSREKVRRMDKLIIKGEMLSYFIKFSELIDS